MTLELVQSIFLIIVVVTFLYTAHLIFRGSAKWKVLVACMLGWAVLTSLLAGLGWFADFTARPPRLLIFVAVQFTAIGYVIFGSRWKEDLLRIPQRYLLRLQSFRIYLEVVLAMLASLRLLPMELTYQGRNFDIVAGVGGLILARVVTRRGEVASRGLILGYNVLGLALLASIVTHGILSAPFPGLLKFDPPNTIMGTFPFHYIPLFLVPVAAFLHFISIRRALRVRSEVDTLERPGVGMSPLETWAARGFIMPRIWRGSTVPGALSVFRKETTKIEELVKCAEREGVSNQRVLIDPLIGLEDSSRNWSVAETVEHLEIVVTGISGIARDLSQGLEHSERVQTARVKPVGKATGSLQEVLSRMKARADELERELGPELEGRTHRHPWFGAMNAKKWVALLGLHQAIHRRQIERILEGAGSTRT